MAEKNCSIKLAQNTVFSICRKFSDTKSWPVSEKGFRMSSKITDVINLN